MNCSRRSVTLLTVSFAFRVMWSGEPSPASATVPARATLPKLPQLTEREQEILKLFAEGMSYAEIGEARGNRPLTIRNAIYGIRDKLGTKSSQEMVVWAVRNGLLDNDEA